MINIYGKGDTVSSSEYWDDRTIYNSLDQFVKYNDNTLAIKNLFNDGVEMLSLLESVNVDKFYAGGIMKTSFQNEFDITQDDYVHITIGNVTRHYIRCSPGIASFYGYANINKPATELAVLELKKIFDLKENDDEFINIKFNYENDTFKALMHKIVDGHMEILEFTNGTDYENDTEPGYNTGIELLYQIYIHPFLTVFLEEAIGDELTKIDLELTKEVDTVSTTYYWTMDENGLIDLVTDNSGLQFTINYFDSASDLANDIENITNPHVYSSETEVISGDLILGGGTESYDKDSGALILTDGGLGVEGNINTGGDVSVGGNLTVSGTTVTVDAETVLIEDNILLINSNESGAGVTVGTAGVEIERGSLTNYQIIFDENDGYFKIGEIGSLQEVATREPTPSSSGIAVWDDVNKLFTTASALGVLDGKLVIDSNDHTVNALQVIRNIPDPTNTPAIMIANDGDTGDIFMEMRSSAAATDVDIEDAGGSVDAKITLYADGNATFVGDITANKVYGAVWNDVAEFMYFKDKQSEPGEVLVMTKNGVSPSFKRGSKSIVGVHSDTFGYALGSDEQEKKTPVGLTGRVNVLIKDKCKIGDLLISGKNGCASVKRWYDLGQGKVLGKVMQDKKIKELERVEMLILMS